jgi:hypothetical protein
MGYTHYFPHTATDQEVWDKIVADCKKILAENKIPLCRYGGDNEKPILDSNSICFNGFDDEGHETFELVRKGSNGFTSCKTDQKPYDALVCACLLVYVHHSPNTIELSIVEEILGYKELFESKLQRYSRKTVKC